MRMCEECGSTVGVETHHIIFRSQNKILIDWAPNLKDLCPICHRGDNGPHKNRDTDLKYKLQLQKTIEEEMTEEYYTENLLILTLGLNTKQVIQTIKTLKRYKEGYKKEDIIRQLMGGKIYASI